MYTLLKGIKEDINKKKRKISINGEVEQVPKDI